MPAQAPGSAELAMIRAGALRRAARRLREVGEEYRPGARLLEIWAVEMGEASASPLAASLAQRAGEATATQERQDRAVARLAEYAIGGVFAVLDTADAVDVLAHIGGHRETVADLSRAVEVEDTARRQLAQDLLDLLRGKGAPATTDALWDAHVAARAGEQLNGGAVRELVGLLETLAEVCGAQLGDAEQGPAGETALAFGQGGRRRRGVNRPAGPVPLVGAELVDAVGPVDAVRRFMAVMDEQRWAAQDEDQGDDEEYLVWRDDESTADSGLAGRLDDRPDGV